MALLFSANAAETEKKAEFNNGPNNQYAMV
jgi:hypothetical protein